MGLRVWSWAEMSSKKINKKTGAHKAPPPIITKVNTIKDPDPNHEKEPESDPIIFLLFAHAYRIVKCVIASKHIYTLMYSRTRG